MSDNVDDGFSTTGVTARDRQIYHAILCCLREPVVVDYEKFQAMLGLASSGGARNAVRNSMKKLIPDYINLGSGKDPNVPGSSSKPRSRATPKKKTASAPVPAPGLQQPAMSGLDQLAEAARLASPLATEAGPAEAATSSPTPASTAAAVGKKRQVKREAAPRKRIKVEPEAVDTLEDPSLDTLAAIQAKLKGKGKEPVVDSEPSEPKSESSEED